MLADSEVTEIESDIKQLRKADTESSTVLPNDCTAHVITVV
jgi:hypothetical protein